LAAAFLFGVFVSLKDLYVAASAAATIFIFYMLHTEPKGALALARSKVQGRPILHRPFRRMVHRHGLGFSRVAAAQAKVQQLGELAEVAAGALLLSLF
jgi:hypothetical protein